MKNVIAIMFMLVFLSPCVCATPPKNVILFIGDGMGFEQVYAAECYAGIPMFFRSFPYQGDVTTRSADNAVTDSAAAGTAIATGVKVNNGVISMAFPGDGSELQTLLEYYQLAGKKVGLVTTTYLTHATPAVFGAHEASRNNYSAIGQDILIRSRPNVLLGGGENGISPAGATSAGYNVVTDLAGFSATVGSSSYTSNFAGLFGNTYMPYKYDYRSSSYPYPTLAEMTAAAIAALGDDPDGFFLMVEGGLIDQACHSNDIARCVFEVLDFNSAVVTAYNAYSANADTLILVTADHETGGLTVTHNNGTGVLPSVTWSSTNHTAANVPVYAWGKNSLLASGALDNTHIRSICTRDDKATNPYPSVGQTDVPTQVTLSWTAGVGATQHQLVVWTTNPADPVVNTNTTETHYTLTCGAGKTYFWTVNEVDTGITGDTWSFTTQQVQVTLIPAGATWKYFDQVDSDQGAWYSPLFDDSTWSAGPAQLGYGDGDEVTLIDSSPVRAAYYFRRTFTSENILKNLALDVVVDDGCVVYLNGVELKRFNMPTGTIAWNTYTGILANDSGSWNAIAVDPAVTVQKGTNVLAVSVHQYDSTSSDVSFDLKLSGVVYQALEAHDDSALTDEDTQIVIDVLSNDVDPENDPLTVTSVTQPGHGTAAINGDGTITYTPASNFSGTDTFTYTVEDGNSNSDSAVVTITVDSTDNDFPTAVDDAVSTDEGVAITIDVLINDTDPDNDILSIYEVTPPSNGTAVIEGRMVVYTPNAGFGGTDTFTYTAQDTAGGFASATVTVSVVTVNDPPTAHDDAASTSEDTAITIDVLGNDTDPENEALSVKSITQPGHGMAAIDAEGTVTYTPNLNFNGTDTFTYIAGDGLLDSGTATVTITVNPVNDAPSAVDDIAETEANTAVVMDVLANDSDIEGDSLTVVQISDPSHGTVVLNAADQTVTYTPAPGFAGQDSFTYAAFDGDSTSNTATVTVETAAVDYDAYAAAEPIVTYGVVTGTIAGTTAAGDGLVQSIEEGPNGPAAYSLRVEYTLHTEADPAGVSEPVTINLGHTWTGGTADGLLIKLVVGGVWTDITADIADGQYQASALDIIDAQGDIHIQFSDKVNQKKEVKDTLVIDLLYAHIVVGPRNITAQDDSYTIDEDGILTVDAAAGVLINDNDADMDTLTASIAVGPGFGSLTLNSDGSFMYTPDANYNGLDSFTYTASDGNGNSAAAAVVITVTPVNDAPAASNDSATTQQNTAVVIDVLANDFDIDGDTLAVTGITVPTNGTVDFANDTITYTPNADYIGSDSFTYTISDGHGGTAVGTVMVTVTEASSTLDMYIADITMQKITAGKNVYATATVRVLDESGNPVVGATVYGDWSGSVSGSISGTTDGSGLVVLRSANVKNGGTFTFTVTDVVLDGYAYNPVHSETSDSI